MIIGLIMVAFIIGAAIFTEISIRRDIRERASIEEIRRRIKEGREKFRARLERIREYQYNVIENKE